MTSTAAESKSRRSIYRIFMTRRPRVQFLMKSAKTSHRSVPSLLCGMAGLARPLPHVDEWTLIGVGLLL
jgi:hypothetical protein